MENKVIYMNNGLTEDEKDILCKFAFCFGLTDEDIELMLENKKSGNRFTTTTTAI